MSLTICSGLPNMHPSFQFYQRLKILPVKKQGRSSDMNMQKGKKTHPHTIQDPVLPSKRLRVRFPLACRGSTRTHWGKSQGLRPPQRWHGRGVTWCCVSPGPSQGRGAKRAVQSAAAYAACQAGGAAGRGCVGPVPAASCWERSPAAPDRPEGTSPPNVLPRGLTVKCLSSDCADVMLQLWHGVSVIWRHI